MKRRDFITGLGSTAASPMVAKVQQPAQRMRRIGVLSGFAENDPFARSLLNETFVNLKTARALGLTVPNSLLVSAGEVIE